MRLAAKRVLHLVVVLFGVMTLLFLLLRISGDPAASVAGPDASPEAVEAVRHQLGLDRPLWEQYFDFLGNLATFDFGTSFQTRGDALDMVTEQLPSTLLLIVYSFVAAALVGIPLGIAAAMTRNRLVNWFADAVVLIGQAVPVFWFAILLVYLFAVESQALPSIHNGEPESWILPIIALGSHPLARFVQFTRSGLAESMAEDFTRTAVAKGLSPTRVVTRHALRPVTTSLVTIGGVDLSTMLGGSVLVETIFAWPGIGHLLVTSVAARDYPVVEALTFIFAVLVVIVSLIVDLAYEWIDPRVRVH